MQLEPLLARGRRWATRSPEERGRGVVGSAACTSSLALIYHEPIPRNGGQSRRTSRKLKAGPVAASSAVKFAGTDQRPVQERRHLGPNLGVVELSIALHYVFSTPRDKFVWDVSHQIYVHKLLTGRKKPIRYRSHHRRLERGSPCARRASTIATGRPTPARPFPQRWGSALRVTSAAAMKRGGHFRRRGPDQRHLVRGDEQPRSYDQAVHRDPE